MGTTGGGESVWSIAIDPTSHEFPSAIVGYMPPSTVDFLLMNTGNQPTGLLTLSAFPTTGFNIPIGNIESIPAGGGSHIIRIAPRHGLSIGDYESLLTIAPAAGNTNPINELTLPISFSVIA